MSIITLIINFFIFLGLFLIPWWWLFTKDGKCSKK